MQERFSRSTPLLTEEGIERLRRAKIAVFGIGGVGGFAVEALARSGVGFIDVFDNDTVSVSNLNRQIIATESTVGKDKVEVMKERILDIDSSLEVGAYKLFYSAETADNVDLSSYEYIIDAIDTVTSKLLLIEKAKTCGVKIISSMGTGNKLDPTRLEISDIYKTSVCPLARVMRTELKRRGIKNLKVLFSKEEPIRAVTDTQNSRHSPASVSFVPSVGGLIIAGEVIRDIAFDK